MVRLGWRRDAIAAGDGKAKGDAELKMFYGFGLMQLHAEVSIGMLFNAWLSLITYARWYKRNGEASREEKGTPLFPASRMTLSGGTKGKPLIPPTRDSGRVTETGKMVLLLDCQYFEEARASERAGKGSITRWYPTIHGSRGRRKEEVFTCCGSWKFGRFAGC